MTTIAFRGGILAADTQISYQTFVNGGREKITKLGPYSAVAIAGPTRYREIFERWVRNGASRSQIDDLLLRANLAALVIKEGLPYEFEEGFLVPVHADYTAVGSGSSFALGAMAHGASAEEAVLAASAHDKATGGPVTTLSIPTR